MLVRPALRAASSRQFNAAVTSCRSRQSGGRKMWKSGGLARPASANARCAAVIRSVASATLSSPAPEPAPAATAVCPEPSASAVNKPSRAAGMFS